MKVAFLLIFLIHNCPVIYIQHDQHILTTLFFYLIKTNCIHSIFYVYVVRLIFCGRGQKIKFPTMDYGITVIPFLRFLSCSNNKEYHTIPLVNYKVASKVWNTKIETILIENVMCKIDNTINMYKFSSFDLSFLSCC